MPQKPRNRLDRSNQVATGGSKSDEQCCQVHPRGDNHANRAAPEESGRGLDRNSGTRFRNWYRSVGYWAPVPKFWPSKFRYFEQIRRNRSWSGVEPKVVRAFGRRNFRDKRAWPRIVLYDPRARMDEPTVQRR